MAGVDASAGGAPAQIEIRVDDVSQLFDTLDPFPFRERDLDGAAEEFIVGWARELPRDRPIGIVVHLRTAAGVSAEEVGGALRRYFAYRAEITSRELRELFRVGRVALAIGIAVLVVCIGASSTTTMMFGNDGFAQVLEEGLIIVGWVANWRPIEIFLYDWWPIVRRRRLYRRLAEASVQIRAAADA